MQTYRDWDALLPRPAAQSGPKIRSKNIWIICKSHEEKQHRLHLTTQRIRRREIRTRESKAIPRHQHTQNEHTALDHIHQKNWFIHLSVLKLLYEYYGSRSKREFRSSLWNADLIAAELHDGTITLHDWRRRGLLWSRVFQNQQDQEGLQYVHTESQILGPSSGNESACERQSWRQDVGSDK